MVERPEEWKWSSYRTTAGREKQHSCLATDWVLGQFSTKRGRPKKNTGNLSDGDRQRTDLDRREGAGYGSRIKTSRTSFAGMTG